MKVFWFDTETSGIDPNRHGIISLAYAIEIDGQFPEHGKLFSNCTGKEIEDGALKVNGFTREEIAAFPPPIEMYRSLTILFEKYVDKYDKNDKWIAGGYNVNFDVGFLHQLWLDCNDNYFGSWFAFSVIDPIQIIRFLQYAGYDFPTSAKLSVIAEHLGIDNSNAHDALSDIRMTIQVVRKIQKLIEEKK